MTHEGDGDDTVMVVALLLVVMFFKGPWGVGFVVDIPAASFSGQEWEWGWSRGGVVAALWLSLQCGMGFHMGLCQGRSRLMVSRFMACKNSNKAAKPYAHNMVVNGQPWSNTERKVVAGDVVIGKEKAQPLLPRPIMKPLNLLGPNKAYVGAAEPMVTYQA
ncbi:hypothetical protein BYT27DRAFT_7278459 [Phlegmacium glaucopus]|nr:hypothetical protein BYT27DRAFT_7278459 [Phlegmacium glaucopus]